MNKSVSADVLRATILAGTVASSEGRRPLPTAWSPDAPEPGSFERVFASEALRVVAGDLETAECPTPASGAPFHTLEVGELLGAYRAGSADPVEVVEALSARLAAHPGAREAMLAMVPGAAAMAQESRDRYRAGAARTLEGVPFGIKDIIDVEGAPVTGGSRLTGDRIAAADACVVARLRAHGAIPLAMLGTTEFASGSAHNPRYGAVSNPWNAERWTGGSSTGSGWSLAGRLLPLALGSDTGGSIRVPSAWCGISGLKPTRGLVPRTGVLPLSWTLDHVGPMARSAADLARICRRPRPRQFEGSANRRSRWLVRRNARRGSAVGLA
jgi:aspartyl-tRNA(Asn)/glutamyl-tRNA(Gln) amidotransferase subunit A